MESLTSYHLRSAHEDLVENGAYHVAFTGFAQCVSSRALQIDTKQQPCFSFLCE